MQFDTLLSGRILRRYKRFLADIELADGHIVTAHCPNTGSMRSCWREGAPVELSVSDNPKRKLPYTLERVDMGHGWIGVNTARVNGIIAEGVAQGRIASLQNYPDIQREPVFTSNNHPRSRFDLFLSGGSGIDAYIEIKNCTLLIGDSVQFPDAISERGRKHLLLLAEAVERGFRGVILFAVNRPEGSRFEPARAIDPEYADCLEAVVGQGVEIVIARLKHSENGISVGGSLNYPS